MASFEKISSEQMDNFMEVLGFKELSIKERTGNLRRTVKEKVYEKDFGAGKIRIYSSVAGVESRDVGKDAIRVQYWVDGVKVYGATRVHRVKNWRNNVLNRIYSLEDMVSKGSLRKVPKDSSGSPMVVRKARRGGKKFWGSSDYPRNNETRRFDAAVVMTGKPVTAVEKAMAWNRLIKQADLHQMLVELEHNVRIGLISEDEIMSSLKEKFGAEDESMWCACGCDGKIADHDDRGYGCWPCIECGDDSDTDINEMCSDCELDIHEAEYNTVANSPLGEIVTDDNGRRFVLVDEEFAQIIFEQSPVFRAPSSPVVLDSVEEMLKTTRKRLNAEDRWLECRWCGEKNNELCDCISCLGCYEIALDETTTCPMDDDICSGCCTEPCCYHSEEAYIDLNAEDYGVGALWMAEYEQSIDISMDCPKCNETMEIIGEGGSRSSENLMNFEYYCDCDEKPKPKPNFNTNPCSKCGMEYDKRKDYPQMNDLTKKNATQYWQMCEICHKGFCGDWVLNSMSSIDCQLQNGVCNDCEPFDTYGKYRAEDEEEIDDDEYWEPYLEALEAYWYACVRYVDKAGESYSGIVDWISLWQEVSEQSSHTLSYVVGKLWKFKYDAYRMVWNQEAESVMDFVMGDLTEESQNLLEDFNPENRDYNGETVYTSVWGGYRHGPPELKIVKEVFKPHWLDKEEGEPYSFDLYR